MESQHSICTQLPAWQTKKAPKLYLETHNSGLRGKLINMNEDIRLTIQENAEVLT
jgi:tellurite resistance-related uncharacterized protein